MYPKNDMLIMHDSTVTLNRYDIEKNALPSTFTKTALKKFEKTSEIYMRLNEKIILKIPRKFMTVITGGFLIFKH